MHDTDGKIYMQNKHDDKIYIYIYDKHDHEKRTYKMESVTIKDIHNKHMHANDEIYVHNEYDSNKIYMINEQDDHKYIYKINMCIMMMKK